MTTTAAGAEANGTRTEEQQQRIETLESARLPVDRLQYAFPHLRRPFSPPAVKWKVQNDWEIGAVIIAYIDARLVIERLNAVCPTMWQPRFEPGGGDNLMVCHLTLDDGVKSLTRSDVGAGQGRTPEDKAKAMRSDALKRAAVHFGVGVPVYSMKAVTLNVGDGDGELRTQMRNKKQRDGSWRKVPVPFIDKRTEKWLAELYERWLEARGIAMFGPPLDHGDEFGAAGIEEMGLPDQHGGRDTMGDGDGDGAEPGWGDKLTAEQIGMIEHVIAMARTVGHTALGDRGGAQVELASRPEHVEEWLREADVELREFIVNETKRKRRERIMELAGTADRALVQETWSAGPEALESLALRMLNDADAYREGDQPDAAPEADRLGELASLLHEESLARQA